MNNVSAAAAALDRRTLYRSLRAFRNGDFSVRLPVDLPDIDGQIAEAFNDVVELNQEMMREFNRLSIAVGKEGKIGQRGKLPNAKGAWLSCVDSVNSLIGDMAHPTSEVARVIGAVAQGDLSQRMMSEIEGRPLRGEFLRIGKIVNTMVGQLGLFASEVTRVAREVGTEGKLGGQARVKGVAGTWKDLTENVNAMATNLTGQVRNIAEVTTAVARGDLSKKITVDVKGEILELKNTINTMVDQLNSFASEVTRVAREVGTEGKLGGQAQVKGVAGTWKDLTENVNAMATNLTGQVRGIAAVVTAVARGDLTRTLTVDAKGEIAALAETINGMITTLATFGDQVTNVAREVGIEGQLGGQARVPGAAGLWRDLTDNVNQLAANLTTQVRAIAEVSTAVTKGDLTRSITVEASGEVAALKDNINEMIRNLKDTTLKNTEQDWLKTNLTRFTRLVQGERDLVTVSNLILSKLAPLVDAQHGAFYVVRHEKQPDGKDEGPVLELLASYAYKERKTLSNRFRLREGLVGQCAFEKQRILLTQVSGDYIQISSGLGSGKPRNIVILPVLFEGEVQAVLELASLNNFSETHLSFLDQLMESIGIVLNTIAANMRTEGLLKQSQMLTAELQSQQTELTNTNDRLEQQAVSLKQSEELLKNQQEELRRKNEELQEKAHLLAIEKQQVEATNREVEKAKMAVEEKAEQLALTSKYKSEFLANMSHELRTPLNSMLVLSKLLSANSDKHLTEKEVEFANTIYSSGSDLLSLINDILDLSKVESGVMTVQIGELRLNTLIGHLKRTFEPVAADKKLEFAIDMDKTLPAAINTDEMRLQQVLFNLLSNAFKFTEVGKISVSIANAKSGWSPDHPVLGGASSVIAFAIRDTGIGISKDNQKIIFEAFQQADGSTSRKYGGTGLGLSICRELARLLGGEITVESESGRGSLFTFYLPLVAATAESPGRDPGQGMPLVSRPLRLAMAARQSSSQHPVADDRAALDGGAGIALIVEDDPDLATRMVEAARAVGFKCVVNGRDREVLNMAKTLPVGAILFDVGGPDSDGWVLMDQLKDDPQIRHIPVTVVADLEHRRRGLHLGAFAFLPNPPTAEMLSTAFEQFKRHAERKAKRLLIVQEKSNKRPCLSKLFESKSLAKTVVAPSGAVAAIAKGEFDCVIVDHPSDPVLAKFLDKLRKLAPASTLPVVIYAPKGIVDPQMRVERALFANLNLRVATTQGDLMDDVSLFLHRRPNDLPAADRVVLQRSSRRDTILAGMHVAIIDDDIRNIFALTSLLERFDIKVAYAEDGKNGIEMLRKCDRVDAVLVDIMMPEMDGYDTMREIQKIERFKSLPLIAVTAKAMREDREKCFEAGASDYISKPVDTERLLSILRTVGYRQREVQAAE